jgi:DNA (cytosine-5)-methyltransferase 1
MRVGSLFSGIGGLDLGLERAGMRVAWQCESDPYCRRVLTRHWLEVPCYEDIRTVEWESVERVDLVCGGFPCQPVSVAGKQLAQDDERWLWPEFVRCLRVVRPRYVLVENVPGLLVRGMGDVLGDLAELGYDAEWQSLPAAAFGAPHLRWRIFIVAHSHGARRRTPEVARTERIGQAILGDDGRGDVANAGRAHGKRRQDALRRGDGSRQEASDTQSGSGGSSPLADSYDPRREQQRRIFPTPEEHPALECCGWWSVEPDVGRVAHGVPARVDRLRALGNAVVPQVAEWIGRRILEAQ